MADKKLTALYILFSLILILLVVLIFRGCQDSRVQLEYFAHRDSVDQAAKDSIFKHLSDIDTMIQANNVLIKTNEGEVNNYYITNRKEINEILYNDLDSFRVAAALHFLDSLYRSREQGKYLPGF